MDVATLHSQNALQWSSVDTSDILLPTNHRLTKEELNKVSKIFILTYACKIANTALGIGMSEYSICLSSDSFE